MSKPAWMNEAEKRAERGEWERLSPGGHKCVIKQIEPLKSKSGLDMWLIYFDTDVHDAQPCYFSEAYKNDTRPDKTWGGRQWYIVDENASFRGKDGVSYYGQDNLAKFTGAIEKSNEGFAINWKADYRTQEFLNQFANKKIGIVFREEEYTKEDHTVGMSVKPMYFRSYEKAEEAKIPKLKEAPKTAETPAWTPAQGASGANGFMQLADALMDEGLPFNS